MKKLWAGRFKEKTAGSVEAFTESISFDWRLWPYDIQGSIAHARMLVRQGIISGDDADRIITGLQEIASEIEAGKFRFRQDLEDIHMNIEAALIKKIGPSGGKLHTARSRNDQVALDLRLYLRAEVEGFIKTIKKLQRVLLSLAQRHADTIMPGYTHLQRAQPVTLGHHLLAYVEMFQRDRERLQDALKRINTLPLGACALAGTTLPIDRAYVARLLKFKRIADNSMDAVSDRDFALEFLSIGAILMLHLSRMAEELVLWSTEEFSFIELPDAFTTGSSIMPQKKNPDVAELIRGKVGRVYGALIGLLTTMKALPLAYNRDMQEDKLPVFDTVDTLNSVIDILTEMLPKIKFDKKRMHETAAGGYSLATDLAEYLVGKGLPFRDAHEVTGRIVGYAIERGSELHDLTLDEFKGFSPLIGADIFELLTIENAVKRRKSRGGTSPDEVRRQIARLRKAL
ncbi:Argininosuccinate lyase [hydrothermal vent metagenome]|uniref:Argininosuccinate lyase n=1 Tax=hydrothermal vent metagenome TaxID=652676 RepID=A0A3B1DVT6_9ZZZZ